MVVWKFCLTKPCRDIAYSSEQHNYTNTSFACCIFENNFINEKMQTEIMYIDLFGQRIKYIHIMFPYSMPNKSKQYINFKCLVT